ncbi:hypothetical protein DPMN_149907 [Dreissena polymorpha]|uniref:Uncharacterized protein n=1 Tax=Dreissena polymorpha TaxID=45954 RepID=A0A9D4J5F6_DREPO|nr:hypothetical protein DPMN_149907 [Dreissena polymorpha]
MNRESTGRTGAAPEQPGQYREQPGRIRSSTGAHTDPGNYDHAPVVADGAK